MSKDRLKPQLNAVVSLNLDDSGDDIGEGTDELVTAQFQNWSGSLIFSMPLGNRDAKTRLANSRVEIRRSELTRQALEQQIFAEVRTAVRKFVSAQRTIEAASEAVRLAETQLAAEKERLRLGLATNYEVLQIEQDLARERNTHLDAVIDYQNALTDIAKTTGSILADRGIIIE
jgi:outer membrane protein TolC